MAAHGGHHKLVDLFLQNKSDPNQQQQMCCGTPLHIAINGGHCQVAEILLNAGADKERQDFFNLTPLQVKRMIIISMCRVIINL